MTYHRPSTSNKGTHEDPLAPGLHALFQHDALVAASARIALRHNVTHVYHAFPGITTLVTRGDLPPEQRGVFAHPTFVAAFVAACRSSILVSFCFRSMTCCKRLSRD